MATNYTRFEISLPQTYQGTPQDDAINTFRHNMEALIQNNPAGANRLAVYTAYEYDVTDNNTQHSIMYGLLTAAQQSTALGYLNTLNAALGSNVLCTVHTVTSEP